MERTRGGVRRWGHGIHDGSAGGLLATCDRRSAPNGVDGAGHCPHALGRPASCVLGRGASARWGVKAGLASGVGQGGKRPWPRRRRSSLSPVEGVRGRTRRGWGGRGRLASAGSRGWDRGPRRRGPGRGPGGGRNPGRRTSGDRREGARGGRRAARGGRLPRRRVAGVRRGGVWKEYVGAAQGLSPSGALREVAGAALGCRTGRRQAGGQDGGGAGPDQGGGGAGPSPGRRRLRRWSGDVGGGFVRSGR